MPDKKLSQKYGDKIRVFADNIAKIRTEVFDKNDFENTAWNSVFETYKNKQGKTCIGVDFDKLAKVFQSRMDMVSSAALWLAEHTVRGLNKLLVDNKVLQKLDDVSVKIAEKTKKPAANLMKKHSGLVSYLTYYAAASVLIAGAAKISNADNVSDKEQDKQETVLTPQEEHKKFKDFVLNPNATDEEWKKQIDLIQPYVIAHILSTEGFVDSLYYDKGDTTGTPTIAAGFILNDDIHRDFAEKTLGRKLEKGSIVSKEDAKKLTDAWLRRKVYPNMKREFNVEMPVRMFISLVVAAYNAGESIYKEGNSGRPVATAVNAGESIESIVNKYVRAFGKTRGTEWGGLANKYAVCALYMMDRISEEVILNSVSDAPSSIGRYVAAAQNKDAQFDTTRMKTGRLLVYDGYAKTAKPVGVLKYDVDSMLLKVRAGVTRGTKQEPVRNFFCEKDVDMMEQGLLFHNDTGVFMENLERYFVVQQSESEKLKQEGERLFFARDFAGAENKYKQALKKDKNNFIVYVNLSALYHIKGDYQKGLETIRSIINSGRMKQVPNDKKAYMYYISALCREGLGDNAKTNKEKLKHYNLAKENLKLSEQFGGKIHEQAKAGLDEKIKNISVKQVNAFHNSIKQIRQKNAKHDLLLYGIERKIDLT